jgi:hypothetical protein
LAHLLNSLSHGERGAPDDACIEKAWTQSKFCRPGEGRDP